MILKICGGILLILSGSMTGYCKSREYRQHIKDVEALKKIIDMMRGEMMYSRVPLREICARIGVRSEEPYSTWLKHIENELESKGEQRLNDIWSKTCSMDLRDCRLSREEKEELAHLGSQIGNMDAGTQENILKLYSIRLEESRKRYEAEIGGRSRICRCLGVSSGILLTILLI